MWVWVGGWGGGGAGGPEEEGGQRAGIRNHLPKVVKPTIEVFSSLENTPSRRRMAPTMTDLLVVPEHHEVEPKLQCSEDTEHWASYSHQTDLHNIDLNCLNC